MTIMTIEEAKYRLAECACYEFYEGFVCEGCQIAKQVLTDSQTTAYCVPIVAEVITAALE